MILPGDKLDEMCRAVWGADWKSVLSRRLGMSRMTLHRWSKKPTGLPAEARRQLLEATEDQLAIVAQYVDELRQDVGSM